MKRYVICTQYFLILYFILKIYIDEIYVFFFICIIKKENPKVMLPSSVFESEVEEKVGLLNKAAPQSGKFQ